MLEYRKEVLPNGVRIVTEEIPYVRSVSLGLWVNVGSRNEEDLNSGISHFIEHMLFKGTKNRTAREIAESIESVGGVINAFTSKEYTCFYTRVLDEHLDLAIEILGDMFFNSLFNDKDLETERRVILEEINMYEDSPDEIIHDLLAQTIWKGHALGRAILGTNSSVQAISRESIMTFLKQQYSPQRTVIAAAGNFSHDVLVDKLRSRFGRWQNQISLVPEDLPCVQSAVVSQKKDTEQVNLCLGAAGIRRGDERIYTLQVLNNVLGGGVSSRLFQEIREQRGLAYTVFSYHSAFKDSGLFGIYAGTSPGNVSQVLELLVREISKIKKEGILPSELQRTKDQIKGGVYLGLESVSNRMSRLGKSELCQNRVIDPDEVIEKINAVQLDDVLNLAREIFDPRKMALVMIGPEKQSIDLDYLLGKLEF